MASHPASYAQLPYAHQQYGHRSTPDPLHRYQPPHQESLILPSGFQYRLNINLVKADLMTKVIISKEARLQKDFFSDPKEMVSDGFEEKSLIYRIRREILIENLLKKNMNTSS